MYVAVAALVVAMVQPQLRVVDAGAILYAALEAVIPVERRVGDRALEALGDRTLVLDTLRTTKAFRTLDPQVSPDYRDVKRPYSVGTREQAISCDRTDMLRCRVANDGVYASITSIEPDSQTGGYRVNLLVLKGGSLLSGYQQELFVERSNGGWRVSRFGSITVIN